VGFRLRENLPLVGGYAAGFFAVFASGLRKYLPASPLLIENAVRQPARIDHGVNS